MASTNELFPWRAQYSVGVPEIDSQHKKLVSLINELHVAMARGEGKQALSAILSDLIRYTENHFRSEENLLRIRGYAGLAEHHELHVKLTAQVLDLQERFKNGRLALSTEVMHFLKGWLANHILGADLRYASDLRAKV